MRSVDVFLGSSGSPILVINGQSKEDGSEDISEGKPNLDIIIGVASSANYSSLEDSGIGCVMINNLEEWMQSIILPKVSLKQFCL